MPRNIDLFSGNFKVTHDPNARLSINSQKYGDVPDFINWCTTLAETISGKSDFLSGLLGLGTGTTFLDQITSAIQSLIDELWNLLTCGTGSSISLSTITTTLGDVMSGLNSNPLVSGLISFAESIGVGASNALLSAFHGLSGFIDALFGALTGTTVTGINPAGILAGFDLLSPLIDFLRWIWTEFGAAVDTFLKPVFTFLNWLWTEFGSAAETFLKPVLGFLNWVWTEFGSAVETFLKPVLGFLNWIWTEFGSAVETFLKPVYNFFGWLFSLFGIDATSGSLNPLKEIFTALQGLIGTFGSIASWIEALPGVSDVLGVINSLTGGTVATISDGITALVGWAQKIPVLSSLVGSLLGGWVNPTTGTGSTLPDLIAYAAKLVTDESVVLAQNLLGFIPQELISLIPVGSVGNTQPNLVTDQGFSSSAVLQTGNGWTWDNANNSGSTGGSAKVTGDGGVKQLFSNLIAVSQGQQMSLSAYVKWTKDSTATPTFLIGLRGYDASNAQTFTTTVSSVISKTAYTSNSSSGYTAGANTTATVSGSWIKIAGSYTIPAGTTQVRMLLGMTNGPSGTTGWFDDVYTGKTSLLGQDLVSGLVDQLLGLLPTSVHQQLLNVLGNTPGANLTNVLNQISSFLTGSSALNGSNILSGNIDSAHIADLISTWVNTVFGISGQTPTSSSPSTVASTLSGFATSMANQGSRIQSSESTVAIHTSRLNAAEPAITALQSAVTALQTKVGSTTTPTPPVGATIISVVDDFERTTGLGSNWTTTIVNADGSNLGIPNYHDAQFSAPSLTYGTAQVAAAWNGTGKAAASQYQRVYTTLGSAAGQPAVGTSGFNDLIAKANPASPLYGIVCRFYADGSVKIFYRVGAWESNFWSPSNLLGSFTAPIKPTTGTQLEFYAGDKSVSDQTKCYAKVGTAVIGPVYIGASALAAMGTGWGFGMGNGLSGFVPQTAGTLNYWGAQDQT